MDIVEIIEGLYESNIQKIIPDLYENSFEAENDEKNGVQTVNNLIESVNNTYTQNQCEYVENLFTRNLQTATNVKNIKNTENSSIYKAFDRLRENSEYYEVLSRKNSENVNESFQRSINNGFSSGYVDNIVNNSPLNVKNTELINNKYPMEENLGELQNYCSDNRSYIPQAMEKNYNNSSSSSNININMGEITQNITGENGDEILDMLVEKLIRGIYSGGENYR